MISKNEIIADLQRVAEVINDTPTEAQYQEHGSYSMPTVRDRFGSLPGAREAAGVGKGEVASVTRDMIINDLRSVADQLGSPPSQSEYREYGEYSVRVVHNKFESWIAARKAGELGEGPRQIERQTEEELLDAIRDLSDKIGRVPGQSDMIEQGRYSDVVYYQRFGSWTTAVREAGFEPRDRGAQPGDENPAWKGGSIEQYYGPNWHEQRQACLERDGWECQHCAMTEVEHQERWEQGLNVHHIRPRREFLDGGVFDWESANELQNLVSLCNEHHELYEGAQLRPHNVPVKA